MAAIEFGSAEAKEIVRKLHVAESIDSIDWGLVFQETDEDVIETEDEKGRKMFGASASTNIGKEEFESVCADYDRNHAIAGAVANLYVSLREYADKEIA